MPTQKTRGDFGVGKKPALRKVSSIGAALHRLQGALNLVELLRLAEKLQGDVKCFGADPANIRRETVASDCGIR